MELDERKKKILYSVVEDYILSAEPVGSKTIVDKHNLEYSSATIRNEMKILENEGYLEQPHVSAGRIPSTKGYRYYVDNLMKENQLSMVDMNYIDNNISGYGDTEKLLQEAAGVISKLLLRPTVLSLKKNKDVLEHIKVLKISDKLLLVVILSKNGTVKDCFAKLTDEVPEEIIDELTNHLDQNLRGTPFEKLQVALNEVISKELKRFGSVLTEICDSIKYEFSKENKKLNSGVESILELPEFSDVDRAKNFVNMLSTKDIIQNIVEKIDSEKLGIVIGSENSEVLLKDYSIISLNIEDDKGKKGSISVISPKRIDYSRTVSILKYINEKCKGFFEKKSKEEEDGKKR